MIALYLVFGIAFIIVAPIQYKTNEWAAYSYFSIGLYILISMIGYIHSTCEVIQ